MSNWLLFGAGLLSLILLTGCKLTRWGYESAEYKVVRRDGAFELRDYPALTLVSTPMQPARSGANESFMRLFRYISGANQNENKIAMTTPVMMGLEGTNREMSFVLPKAIAAAGAPRASREDIRTEIRLAGHFAVYRFRGSWDSARAETARKTLMKWVTAAELRPVGEPQLANYDPPFTPPFLRRNEVMIRVERSANQR